MYASKMVNEMLLNLCCYIFNEKIFRKNHRILGNVWEASAHHSDNTNIDKCDKKYFEGCDHSLPGFVCQRGEGRGRAVTTRGGATYHKILKKRHEILLSIWYKIYQDNSLIIVLFFTTFFISCTLGSLEVPAI